GHDMHVTWLAGATKLLAEARTAWRGTLMAVFQPAEETGEGAQAMIDDGLFRRFPKPDVILGQHVMVGPSGTVAGRSGAITSAAGNHDDRSIPPQREQSGCHQTGGGRFPRTFRSSARPRNGAGPRQRGFRFVRIRMARPLRLLVRWRH